MKKLMTETLKAFALFGCVSFMIACNGDTCQTCTKDGETDLEVCDSEFASDSLYLDQILVNEADGWDCAE